MVCAGFVRVGLGLCGCRWSGLGLDPGSLWVGGVHLDDPRALGRGGHSGAAQDVPAVQLGETQQVSSLGVASVVIVVGLR